MYLQPEALEELKQSQFSFSEVADWIYKSDPTEISFDKKRIDFLIVFISIYE